MLFPCYLQQCPLLVSSLPVFFLLCKLQHFCKVLAMGRKALLEAQAKENAQSVAAAALSAAWQNLEAA